MRPILVLACFALACASGSVAQQSDTPADAPAMLARPDVSMWPTIGSTMRMDPKNPALPGQLRQVQMEAGDYENFLHTRRFADGTRFAVMFYSVSFDASHSPPFYHANKEVAFAMEVIDRSHVDGRRFYLFNGASQQAAALPPGNECAVCHRDRGTFDGTFAHLYPLISKHVAIGVKPASGA